MNLAARDIRHNLGRFVLTSLGLGLLVVIVMGMGGIYRGIVEDATLLVDRLDADLWIVQRDTKGPFAEISRVPIALEDRALAVQGVASARRFVTHTIQRDYHGRPLRMAVVGLAWPHDRGDWLPLLAGRSLRQGHYEMIADRSLGLAPGQLLRLGKDEYTVVGLTSGMVSSAGDGLAFFTASDALAIQFDTSPESTRLERAARRARAERIDLGATQPTLFERARLPNAQIPALGPPQVSAVLVNVKPGYDTAAVAATLDAWPDVSVFSSAQQRQLLLRGPVDKARRQIGMFRTLLVVISAIIVALILYTLTLDKLHDIALLKLIGARDSLILALVLQEALMLGAAAYLIAYLAAQRLFPHFPRRVIVTPDMYLWLAGAVTVICVLGSLLGIWRAMRVEAREVLT
ncbi:MAG: ABC transporter permease [Leptolyngbya sp. PLA3]|nr:MAG: ABC transporter permease [Cyanobacteria bacterium CYA]MCE7968455.1 ABC transporter permease [Leptolyngbya sp. PL-A3]